MIREKDLAILEFGPDDQAVIMPNHEGLDLKLPDKAVFAFVGEKLDRFALDHKARTLAYFESATKTYPIYAMKDGEEEVCLVQAPVGAPSAVQLMDWLIAYGVKIILSTGSCGVLVDYDENELLVPYKALRDEGTSFH